MILILNAFASLSTLIPYTSFPCISFAFAPFIALPLLPLLLPSCFNFSMDLSRKFESSPFFSLFCPPVKACFVSFYLNLVWLQNLLSLFSPFKCNYFTRICISLFFSSFVFTLLELIYKPPQHSFILHLQRPLQYSFILHRNYHIFCKVYFLSCLSNTIPVSCMPLLLALCSNTPSLFYVDQHNFVSCFLLTPQHHHIQIGMPSKAASFSFFHFNLWLSYVIQLSIVHQKKYT